MLRNDTVVDGAPISIHGVLVLWNTSGRTKKQEPQPWKGEWKWEKMASHITLRELKDIGKLLMGHFGRRVETEGVREIPMYVENGAIVHINNIFVSASCPAVKEIRRIKLVLDGLRTHVRSKWVPSVVRKLAEAISRGFNVEKCISGIKCGVPSRM